MSKDISALDKLTQDIDKRFGKGVLMDFETAIDGVEFISSGSLELDNALGGGYAKGRVVEIYGSESAGKTSLAIHAMVEAQKQGGVVGFIDAEHAFDPNYAKNLGLDLSKDKFKFCQPDNGEQGLEMANTLIESGLFAFVVVDSVAALTPKAEIDGEMGESKMGLQARLMSQALRKMAGSIKKTNTICFFINQLRDKLGVVFGNPETTTGGNALKFYASQRLDIRRSTQIKDGEEVIGNLTRVKVIKNKVAPPFRKAEFNIMYGKGIDTFFEMINIAVDLGIVKKAGSWYSYEETKLGQGMNSVCEILEDNHELYEEIENKVKEIIKNA